MRWVAIVVAVRIVMTEWLWLLDAGLAVALLAAAARLVVAPDLFEAVALFVVFGLLMTLAWVRLSAPDVALAEAAISTGFTGALLVAAVARLNRQERERTTDADD